MSLLTRTLGQTLAVDTRVLVQPPVQLGEVLVDILDSRSAVDRVVLVSAFVNRLTLLRLRARVELHRRNGATVRFVLGIDLDGTSEETLRELENWDVEAFIVKNTQPGHTFHPKIYLVESPDAVDLVIGSSNLTEGGFYKNYEAATHVTFLLPTDQELLNATLADLDPFINPSGPDSKRLNLKLIEELLQSGAIHSESVTLERRRRQGVADQAGSSRSPLPFGRREMPSPPPLPIEIVRGVARRLSRRRSEHPGPISIGRSISNTGGTITPSSFYMVLNRLQGPNIPGEVRVPLAARNIAPEFWGWPSRYREEIRNQGNEERNYSNWKPRWRVGDFTRSRIENVRMYAYQQRSEFRFFSPFLQELGADEGDVIRVTRVSEGPIEFECVVAYTGTQLHSEWKPYCTVAAVGGRLYGYN